MKNSSAMEEISAVLHVMRPPGCACDGLTNLVNTLFPERNDLLVIEIGSYAGESTQLFLNTGKIQKIFCVDPWTTYKDPAIPLGFRSVEEAQNAEKTFDRFFAKDKRVVKIKDLSENVHPLFTDQGFDLVYIDANHEPAHVRQDLKNYIRKVKPGGFIAGHDYKISPGMETMIREIDAFFGHKPDQLFADSSWCYRTGKNEAQGVAPCQSE